MKQAKRVISLLLAAVLLFANCPISAFASNTKMAWEIHEYEDFQYFVLSDGTVSICGYDNAPESGTEGTYLEIPESINDATVTQIAESAFANNAYIDTIAVPESITLVGKSAFANCEDLKAIAFFGVIPELGSDIFKGCDNLNHLYALSSAETEDLPTELEGVSVLEYEDMNALEAAYQEYISVLDAELHVEEQSVETNDTTTETVAEPSETADLTENHDEKNINSINAAEHTTEDDVSDNQAASDYTTNNAVAELSATSNFSYTILNGTYCEITGYTGEATTVSIPAEIDGYIVQSIADSVFQDNTTLTMVEFPETIETMGSYREIG